MEQKIKYAEADSIPLHQPAYDGAITEIERVDCTTIVCEGDAYCM